MNYIPILIRKMPADLHNNIKAEAAHKGVSMQNFIIASLAREVQRSKAERRTP
jgi:predicted HicB family RNase H-like nuclease